jgi:nitrate/nitrite-specific signal transduction histidine kinase
MKPLAVLFIATLLSCPTLVMAQGQEPGLSAAINIAGSQRMLTQRMMKAYSAIGIDVDSDNAQQQLNDAVLRFELQLERLSRAYEASLAGPALEEVRNLWPGHKTTLLAPISKSNAQHLLHSNEKLLIASHNVVLALEDMSETRIGQLVNIAGRQRMLGQRLAMFYMLRNWDIENARIRSESEQARNEFRGALERLISAPENTPAIRAALADAERQWTLFEHSLKRDGAEMVPLIVASTSESLLQKMDEITLLYEQLSNP